MSKLIFAPAVPLGNDIRALTRHMSRNGYISTGEAAKLLGIHNNSGAIDYLKRHRCPKVSAPFSRGVIKSLTYWHKQTVITLVAKRNKHTIKGESDEV